MLHSTLNDLLCRKPCAPPANMFHNASSSSSEEEAKPFNAIKAAAEAKPKIRPADPEDPVYKAITASLNNPSPSHEPKPPPKRQSRYIGKLVKTAAHRKEESTRVSERKLLAKQREQDEIFAGKERFVTYAYREKLKQDSIKDRQEKLEEQAEEERRQEGFDAFYGNLYAAENIAMGGNFERHGKEQAAMEQVSLKPEERNTHKRRRTRFGDAPVDDKHVENLPKSKPKLKKRGLRRNDAKSIEEYRRRYFERRAKRLGTKTNG